MIKIFYISKTGNDNNDGSLKTPFATIEKARDSIRKLNKDDYSEIKVCFMGGRYFVSDTIEFSDVDSGTQNCYITYCALENEEVYFDGGIILKNEDVKPISDETKDLIIEKDAISKIMEIDLKPYKIKNYGEYGIRGFRHSYVNAPNELFIDGDAYEVSKYPKEERLPLLEENVIDKGSRPKNKEFDKRPAIIKYDDDRLLKWSKAKNAYIAGFFAASWADDCIKIANIDTENKTITTTIPHLFSFEPSGHTSWFLVNLLEELSKPGEYYIDSQNEKLYFYPKGEIKNSLIQLSVMDNVMIAIENASFINIEGITFENSRNSGIYIEGGENCKIKNCTFRNLGILAVQIGQGASPQPDGLHTCHGERAEGVEMPYPISREMGSWHEYLYEFAAWDNNGGKNHMIESCTIYNMGAGGVLLSGGNRKNLILGNNTVHNCHFYEVNRLDKTYKSAVNIMGVGNNVTHCHIHDLPGMAIYMHGNDHLIEYNKIHHVLKSVSDSGAIYMGRDMSEVGNIFRYNFIYSIHNPHKSDLGVCAIYFDDWSIYNMVYANYFYDIVSDGKFFFSTIYHTCGGLTSIGNNILIDCFPGFNPNTKSNAHSHMHEDKLSITRVHTDDMDNMKGVDITSEIYKEKYPYLYETYANDFNPGTKYWHNRVYVNQYNDFVDAKNLNFKFIEDAEHLKSNMPEYKITDVVFGLNDETIEIKNIDFDNIGLIK